MFLCQGPSSSRFLWAMVVHAIWIGCPITSCVCTDSRFKLFCGSHESSLGRGASRSEDCCHRKTVPSQKRASGDCGDRESVTRSSGGGCTQVANALLVLQSQTSRDDSFDQALAFHTLALGPASITSVPAAFVAPRPAEGATGPPGNLILRLHRLLI